MIFQGAGSRIGGAVAGEANVISGNVANGLLILGGEAAGNVVVGNRIGTDPTGTAAVPNGNLGIRLGGGAFFGPAHDNVIGGAGAGEGNVISGNAFGGVSVGGRDNRVLGNLIGTDITGTLPLGNASVGIYVDGGFDNGEGGGPANLPVTGTLISGNVIASNGLWGINLFSLVSGSEITGNLIGSGVGQVPLGNGLDGIRIGDTGVDDTTIGGQLLFERNTIANNGNHGVLVLGGTGHAILPNAIVDNVGLGIELAEDGVTPNDPLDADVGPNNLQNHPVLTSAVKGPAFVTVVGRLDSTPDTSFVVRWFRSAACDPSGTGEGAVFMASGVTATNGAGVANSFQLQALGDAIPPGTAITATVTDPDGNTSEFSPCIFVDPAGFAVTNTDDAGPGSLRQAILDTNASAGVNTVSFAIPGAGPHTIQPLSPLPAVTDPVVIDGVTQPGAALGAPKVEIDGILAGEGADGLGITAGNSVVRGLAINWFDESGIVLFGGGGNVLEGNLIGVDVTGTVARGNGFAGVQIVATPGNRVGGTGAGVGNTISGNAFGVLVAGLAAVGNQLQQNRIGTDATGTAAIPNGTGVVVDAPMTVVGGVVPEARNIISGNTGDGVEVRSDGTAATLQLNFIGTDLTATAALGNGGNGVEFDNTSNATVGGTTAFGNVISGNGLAGISIRNSSTTIVVKGNTVGLDEFGTEALGNGDHGVEIDGAPNNQVGDEGDPSSRNIISGNGANGVTVVDSATTRIEANYIGVDATGTVALANAGDGVSVSSSVLVRVSDNVISGNGSSGILVRAGSANAGVEGNFIGTDHTGQVAIGNGSSGVALDNVADNALIDNTIAASAGAGVSIFGVGATGNLLIRNRIGTNANGTVALPNVGGVSVEALASDNGIGSPGAGDGNLISGNVFGIFIAGDINRVEGNLIGTDATGTVALANGGHGIQVAAGDGNTIGGPTAGHRNVVAASDVHGIFIGILAESPFPAPSGTVVTGNYIGTDVTATAALGNASAGVRIHDSTANVIGGAAVTLVNVISGNGGGVVLTGADASLNKVEGNLIGTDLTGGLPLGNTGVGVSIVGDENKVGSNVIAHNGDDGVVVLSGTSNPIQENQIHSNGGLGIDLGGDGVTANDESDVNDIDGGPNLQQNFPTFDFAASGDVTTQVRWIWRARRTRCSPSTSTRPRPATRSATGKGRRTSGRWTSRPAAAPASRRTSSRSWTCSCRPGSSSPRPPPTRRGIRRSSPPARRCSTRRRVTARRAARGRRRPAGRERRRSRAGRGGGEVLPSAGGVEGGRLARAFFSL